MPALEDMRVLDMTQYEAGTSCTQLLAWLGADVVKVEAPGRGDPGRGVAPTGPTSQYFLNYNSNKRSVCLDLSRPEGRQLLLDMVPKFDVFVENYGPGVIEKLGLGYDVMCELNPGLIYGRIKGFGLDGPYSQYKCYDWVAQAAGGSFSMNGMPDGPPIAPAPTIGDSGTGMQMALAITAAYSQKQRTGEGQFIELSMQEAVTLFMRTAGLREWGETEPQRMGSRRGMPTDVYPCKGGGPNDYVFIMVVTSKMWDTLCGALDRYDLLSDPRFETGASRQEHAEVLWEEIASWTRQRTKYEAMEILAGAGVPCSAVVSMLDIFHDPQIKERGLIQDVEHPVDGPRKLMGNPIRMSRSKVELKTAPLLGDNTDVVLGSDLGLSADQISKLREQGIIE